MKTQEFTKQLFNELTEELSVFADLGTLPVRRVTGAITAIQSAFTKLRTFIEENPFKSQDEEIEFFKYQKPKFTAEHYYAMEIFTIETARPVNDLTLLKSFYEQELKYVRRFLDNNKFLYTYYQFDMKELDHLLFVRGKRPADIPVSDGIGLDPHFNTCCDNLWGKFIAFERLREYLLDEIATLERPNSAYVPDTESGKLTWTGGAVNLVELAYGLWLTGQLNDGNASITHIISWLEINLHVKIGRPHRRWETIAARKRLSLTRFLDQMAEAIRKRLDDENGR